MYRSLLAGVAVALVGAIWAVSGPSMAREKVRLAVPAFLLGPAAGPFGVPARNGAEMVIEAINDGALPAPYARKGFAGAAVEAIYVDESGGDAKQVAVYRDLVHDGGVDLVIGYISSGSCTALAPVIEELRRLTIFTVCGTPRIFEDAPRRYIFRTMNHATADGVAAARYIRARFPAAKFYTGINQDYAWGRDSWRDFDLAMQTLAPSARASENLKFPKLFAGSFDTEILDMLLDRSEIVHSSFWNGDLESFIFQGAQHDMFKVKKVVLTVGGSASYRLGKRMPDGVIIGARGPYGILARSRDTALNNWFVETYKERYGIYPTGPAYQYAQGVLAAKIAYDKAASANGGGFPDQDQVMAALRGATFESFSTTVDMALAGGHQAVTEHVYGITKYDLDAGEPGVVDMRFFPSECVMPPVGISGVDWVRGGMPGARC